MRFTKQRLLTLTLAAAILCSVTMLLICPAKAADTGYWSLTKGPEIEPGLEEYLGTTHKLNYKIDHTTGLIYCYRKTSYTTDDDGLIEGNFVTSYSFAPEKINGDETIYMSLSTSVDNNMKNYLHSNAVNVYYNGKMWFYRKSDNSDYGSDLKISTGPGGVLQGSETVYYKIPAGKTAGETMTILAEASLGQMSSGKLVGGTQITWTYTWVVSAPTPTPTPTLKKPVKGTVAKIQNVKGAKVKVTVKAISGATQYQIRYRIGKSRNWKIVTSSKRVFIIKVKNGVKVSVKARGVNAAGIGNWSKMKNFKPDKK